MRWNKLEFFLTVASSQGTLKMYMFQGPSPEGQSLTVSQAIAPPTSLICQAQLLGISETTGKEMLGYA